MTNINLENIHDAVTKHLDYELELEIKKAFKDKKPTQKSIDNKREKLKPNYDTPVWLKNLKESLKFMKSQNLDFATHISKGIHSSVKSDNVILYCPMTSVTDHFVNSSNIINPKIDANSNNTGSHAGHLKLIVSFLNIDIANTRVYQLIKQNHPTIKNFCVQKLSLDDYNYLQSLLCKKINIPITDERNKQTLFPIGKTSYQCIIPLYPSSLTHYIYEKINAIKYSEYSKKARQKRFSKDNAIKEFNNYKDVLNLAVIKLGGENAQNVSRLNNIQSGFHYLLPSLPPIIEQSYSYKLSKFANSIFGNSIAYHAREALENIHKIVKNNKNNVDRRDLRKAAIDEILHIVFAIAEDMRTTLPAGWSKDYDLDREEKLWLDPKRADLEGEEAFKAEREDPNNPWEQKIMHHFARWLNTSLQNEFKDIAQDFADPEHDEWEREIEGMKKLYERAGKGVFL